MTGNEHKEGNGGFGLPPGYFERLKENVAARIAIEEEMADYPWLRDNNKTLPFSVPDGYFESASCRLELAGHEQLVQKRPEAFSVPEDYFAENQVRLRDSLQDRRAGRRPVLVFFRSRTTWAMAAIILVTLLVYVYMFIFSPVEKDCGTVACIDRREIIRSAELDDLDAEELTPAVNADKLGKLLANPPASREEDIE
jgi:hypothetical protein